jgi:hypothetical protein
MRVKWAPDSARSDSKVVREEARGRRGGRRYNKRKRTRKGASKETRSVVLIINFIDRLNSISACVTALQLAKTIHGSGNRAVGGVERAHQLRKRHSREERAGSFHGRHTGASSCGGVRRLQPKKRVNGQLFHRAEPFLILRDVVALATKQQHRSSRCHPKLFWPRSPLVSSQAKVI